MENKLSLFIIKEALESYIQNQDQNIDPGLALPTYIKHGDLTTNIAMRLSKILSKNPHVIAEEIKKYLIEKIREVIEKIEISGPGLLNIFLSNTARINTVESILHGENIFKLSQDKNTHWVIEHTSPNPNKAMHLGHLRNNLVGMSLANLIENSGAQVTRDAVDNNRGIAIAKAMYGFLVLEKKDKPLLSIGTSHLFGRENLIEEWIQHPENWYTPTEKNMRPDVFVTNCYTGGEELRKNDAHIDKIIREIVLDWENKDENTWKLWQHVLDYSYAGMEMTLKRLGNKWDKVWHEHEHYQAGKEYVELGLQKGIFKKLDDGAVLTQIEEKYNIPETILLKNDGTALYITQDIALTDLKKKTYNADKLLWVIGPEQTLAMAQMFAVCEQLGIGKLDDFVHIPYGYMGLKDENGNFQKMSSRSGTVLLIDDLLDTVKEKLASNRGPVKSSEALKSQNGLVGSPGDSEESLREKIALAATKFSILKTDRNMNTAFDINESINITGDSGVYVLYTYARIMSILHDPKANGLKITSNTGESGIDVIRMINAYPLTLDSAREHLSVHPIAHYLLGLCATFNKFYGEVKILDDGDNVGEKLAILESVTKVIKHGLGILGIETVEKM